MGERARHTMEFFTQYNFPPALSKVAQEQWMTFPTSCPLIAFSHTKVSPHFLSGSERMTHSIIFTYPTPPCTSAYLASASGWPRGRISQLLALAPGVLGRILSFSSS